MAFATITSVTPTQGPLAGGITLTVKGTSLLNAPPYVYLRPVGTTNNIGFPAATQTDTQMTVVVGDMTGRGGACDVGVFDQASGGWWIYSPAAYYAGTPPVAVPGVWGTTAWDASVWEPVQFVPGAGWGYDWQVWYQFGGVVQWDMTRATVEARWTTDAHTAGDGTYRGDLQPGSLALQLHDPDHRAEQLDKLGTVWLRYAPTGYVWGFYLDTITRQLVAPGDPTAADVVMTATAWPIRLTTDCLLDFGRPAERVDARLGALVALLSQNTNLHLPSYLGAVAGDSHQVAAIAAPTTVPGNAYPSALALIRAAAANGVAWVSAGIDANGLGQFTLNYARWEAANLRTLGPSDVVAGIPYEESMEDFITNINWQATAANGVTTESGLSANSLFTYGNVKSTMRVWADMTTFTADANAITSTGIDMLKIHGNPDVSALSTVTAISGGRSHPAGGAGPPWNPAAHVWSPIDVLRWTPPAGSVEPWQTDYRVVKTAHRLRAASWDSTHTLELRATATPMTA